MADPTQDSGPNQIDISKQFPGATRVENGVAYDVSGKALGNVDVDKAAQPAGSDPFAAMGATAAPKPTPATKDPFAELGATEAPAPKPEESWWHQNVAGPFMNDVHRIKNSILDNEGPGWGPYDLLTKMGVKRDTTGPFAGIDWNKEIPTPAPATDAEAEAAIKNKAVLPGMAGGYIPKTVEEAKKGIDYLRSQQRLEQISSHEYEQKGENRIVSPERLMTAQEAKDHPVLYGLLHFSGQLTTPENAMIMAGTGGLGFVSDAAAVSPALGALAKTVAATPRMVSAYFAGQMAIGAGQAIPGLYEAKKDYDSAVKAGDMDAANRIKWDATVHATEAAAQGYAAYAAGFHAATGKAEPAAQYAAESTKETLAAMGDTAQQMGQNAAAGVKAAGKAIKETAGAAISKTGALIGRTNDFETAVQRSMKITPKRAEELKQTVGDAKEDLQAILNANPNVESPKDFADAIQQHLQQNEANMQREAGATRDDATPVAPDFRDRVEDRLDKFFDDNRGKFGSAEEVKQAKQDILDRVMQRDQVGTDANGAPIYQERIPNLFESENVRQGLNNETRPQYATNAKPTTDAYKAGAGQAVSEIRDIIDSAYHERGIENVQEFREKEAKLIKIEDSLRDAQAKADKMGEGTIFQSLIAKVGVPSTVVAIALGHPLSVPAIGVSIVGERIHQNISNPNRNVAFASNLAAKNPDATATKIDLNPNAPGPAPVGSVSPRPTPPPVDHATYAALSSYYGKIIGAVPYDKLVSDFQKEIQAVHEKKATGAYTQQDADMEPRRQAMLDKLNAAKMKQRVDAEKAAQKLAADTAKAQAKAAAEAKKQAEKEAAAEEAKRQVAIQTGELPKDVNPHLESLGRGDESGLVSHSPAMKAHAPATEIKAPEGMTSEDVHRHEWAHVAIGAVDGLEPIEIRSNLHPESKKAAATTMFNTDSLKDAGGNVDSEAMANQEVQWLTHKMAGPASHEIFNGLTYDEVKALPGARTDFRQARDIVRQVHPDFTPKQVEDTVTAAYDRARDFLTMPHIADRIRANASVREEGLSPTLHASRGRITQFAEDIRNAHNEHTGTESGPDRGGAGEGGEKPEKTAAEGEKNGGAGKERAGEGASGVAGKNAAASGRTEVKEGDVTPVETKPLLDRLRESKIDQAAKGLKERSTGNDADDAAIKEGGGIPGGRMSMDENNHVRMFHDPKTGTTLGFSAKEEVTPDTVKAKLAASRKQYGLSPEEIGESNVDASPRLKEIVQNTPWTEDEHTGYRKLVLKGKGFGNDIGELQYSGAPGDSYSRIRKSIIEPGYRDQGIAKEMYKSAIEDARKMGIPEFKSDTVVSQQAQNVWNSLMREGKYNITKEYTNTAPNANGQGGVEYTVHLREPKALGSVPRPAGGVSAMDLINALKKK
jgi:predicted GNAT family acetyltransferase